MSYVVSYMNDIDYKLVGAYTKEGIPISSMCVGAQTKEATFISSYFIGKKEETVYFLVDHLKQLKLKEINRTEKKKKFVWSEESPHCVKAGK